MTTYAATHALDMDTWNTANLIAIIREGDVEISNATRVDFAVDNGYVEIHGTGFGPPGGAPSTGTITAIYFRDMTHGVNVLDLNLEVSVFAPLVSSNNAVGLRDLLLGGNDSIWGSDFVDRLHGYAGADTMQGGDGGDTMFGDAGDDTMYGGYAPNSGSTPTNDNDTIEGGVGNDKLFGGVGNDTLRGGEGGDLLVGATGTDTVFGDAGDDYIVASGGISGESYDGGGGVDTLIAIAGGYGSGVYTDYRTTEFRLSNYTSIERLTFGNAGGFTASEGPKVVSVDGGDIGTNFSSTLQVTGLAAHSDIVLVYGQGGAVNLSGWTFNTWSGVTNVNMLREASYFALVEAAKDLVVLFGGASADTFTGTNFTDLISGAAGNDTLNGGGGDDFLNGGAGADAFDGGGGVDWVDYRAETGGLTASLLNAGANQGSASGDTYVAIDCLIGSAFNDVLTGNAQGNILQGQGGDNVLDGGGGADALYGGAGNDTFFVDTAGDIVVELLGYDRVFSVATYAIGAGIEELILTGASAINGTGNGGANLIVGNSAVNTLNGGASNDVLIGAGGADILNGDTGSDAASYATSAARVRVNLNTGIGLDADAQDDTYNSIERLTGSDFNDQLIGSSVGNVLMGGKGVDMLDGRGGQDFLFGGANNDVFVFSAGLGAADTIDDFAVGADKIRLENGIFTGLAAGALQAAAFHVGAAAANASNRIIYNSANGFLYFDKDGTGAQTAINFAVLDAGLAITAADFAVV